MARTHSPFAILLLAVLAVGGFQSPALVEAQGQAGGGSLPNDPMGGAALIFRRPDNPPLHTETGYLRAPTPNRIEWILAHPTGITEIQQGQLLTDGETLQMDLISTEIGRAESAKEVLAVGRSIEIHGDTLTYTLRMAAVGQPLQYHLSAVLRRVTD